MPRPPRQSRRPEPAPRRNREKLIQTPSPEQVPVAVEEEFPEPGAEGRPGTAPAAAPSIRKLARDLGIDLTRVRGSARGGRIVLEDVRAYIQKLQRLAAAPRAAAPAGAPAPKPAPEQIDFSNGARSRRSPLSPLREVIARRMAESWTTTPRVTQFDEADITALMALAEEIRRRLRAKGRAAHPDLLRVEGGRRYAQEASHLQCQPRRGRRRRLSSSSITTSALRWIRKRA